MRRYGIMDAQELLALITNEDVSLQERDEAMWYLLNERLKQRLRLKFEPCSHQLSENFTDVVVDFFLYLREDKGLPPYGKLRGIRNRSSFEGWLVNSFRNFVCKKHSGANLDPNILVELGCLETQDVESVSFDSLICMLSDLVAYCCQELNPICRFVFLRMLLTLLDKSRSLPDKDMAAALGITDVYYRVISLRVRRKVQKIKSMLLAGSGLNLTPESRCLADELAENFSGWYHIIAELYEDVLASFPQFESIDALRYRHNYNLRDSAPLPYGAIKPRSLWYALGEITCGTRVCILREPLA